MTNQEAIEILTKVERYGVEAEAVNLAIKALETPQGDLISRSEAKKLGATCLAKRNENGQLEAIISLDNAPTVDLISPTIINVNIPEETKQKLIEKLQKPYKLLVLPEPEITFERLQGEWIEFARWVAKEVLDDYFEDTSGAFAEIACRKLVKLGLVEVKDNVYKMKGGAE